VGVKTEKVMGLTPADLRYHSGEIIWEKEFFFSAAPVLGKIKRGRGKPIEVEGGKGVTSNDLDVFLRLLQGLWGGAKKGKKLFKKT